MKTEVYTPKAIYGDIDMLLEKQVPPHIPKKFHDDYFQAANFLISYKKNNETFSGYRKDIERFSQWCWFFAKLSFKKIGRDDIENYLQFCRKPPNHWIAKKTVAKFTIKAGKQIPNPLWRPYVVKISKAEHLLGKKPRLSQYRLSDSGFKMIFTALQGFYKHMVLNHYLPTNIIDLIKQKTHYYRKQQGAAKVRRISPLQWEVVMEIAQNMADDEPDKHERTLFIMSMLYGLYLRVSELAASQRWTPMMHHFKKDYEDNWWFTTLGKGNKERTVAVSDAVLAALKRWREHLGTITPLPTATDKLPLVCGRSLESAISSTRQIRNIVQMCFDKAIEKLQEEGFNEQALELNEATVHWLRHTGISDDVKIRPREHVRDDAGHSSSLITDRYIDIDSRERHKSARAKTLG